MIDVFDLKTKQPISIKDEDISKYLILEGDRYVPIQGYNYMVVDDKTGVGEEVKGENLRNALGSGKSIISQDRYAIRKELEAENSQVGQFFKSLTNESVFLGLGNLGDQPTNPWEQTIAEERQKLFGTARKAGGVTGAIAPFLAGGVGGIMRLGAKTAAKKATAEVLKAGGKAPSALALKGVIRAGEKVGDKASDVVKALGGGSILQATAKTGGIGLGFAGAEGILQGTKAGIKKGYQELSKDKEFKGSTKAHNVMNSALGEGFDTFKETATNAAMLMAGLGVAGKVIKGVGVVTQKTGAIAGKGFEKVGELARKEFFKTGANFDKPAVKSAVVQIANAFNLRTGTKAVDVLKTAGKFVEDTLGKTPLKRSEAVGALRKVTEISGERLGSIRNEFAQATSEQLEKQAGLLLNNLKGRISSLKGKTTFKPYVDNLNKIESHFKAKIRNKTFSFKDIKETMDVLSSNSKFLKGKNTELEKAYQTSYKFFSLFENKVLESLAKQTGKTEVAKALIKEKKTFNQAKSILGLMEAGGTTGVNAGTYYQIRELMLLAGGIGGVGGIAGGYVGAGVGALGLTGAAVYVKSTGAGLLQTANFIERASKVFKKVKTPRGVKGFFTDIKEITEAKPVSVATLGFLMLGRKANSIEDLNEGLARMEPLDQYTTGQETLYSSIEDYGGGQNAKGFNESMIKTKALIMETRPKPYMDGSSGKSTYSKLETKAWLNDLSTALTPEGFIKAINSKTLTKKQLQMFSRLYPQFLQTFNLSLMQGLRSGEIKKDSKINHFLYLQKDNFVQERLFYGLDQMTKELNNQTSRRRKLQSSTRPTQSELSQGGVFPT